MRTSAVKFLPQSLGLWHLRTSQIGERLQDAGRRVVYTDSVYSVYMRNVTLSVESGLLARANTHVAKKVISVHFLIERLLLNELAIEDSSWSESIHQKGKDFGLKLGRRRSIYSFGHLQSVCLSSAQLS